MKRQFETLIPAFRGLPDKQESTEAESKLRKRIASYKGTLQFNANIMEKNIGRGADWIVLVLSIGIAVWIIPDVHKKVRNNIEEWCRIYQELHTFFNWVLEKQVALYSDEYLFLQAIETLSHQNITEHMEFKGVTRLPEDNPDNRGRESLLFSFGDTRMLVQVAISRSGEILWKNTIKL